jgi:hypothetical protein
MAFYRETKYVIKTSGFSEFNDVHPPGTECLQSGIYRCETCGHEVACNEGEPLPSQDDHTHIQRSVTILWRLLVRTKQGAGLKVAQPAHPHAVSAILPSTSGS